jgi:hypothetical protein
LLGQFIDPDEGGNIFLRNVLRTKKKGKVKRLKGDKKLRKDRPDGAYKKKITGILLP